MRLICLFIALLCTSAQAAPAPYLDITSLSGIEFEHSNGAFGAHYLPEIMGSGVGLIDFDADGDLDIYLVNGRGFGERGPTPTDRLFRNDGGDPLQFTDVTDAVGLTASDYGMGVAVGDFDGDGFDDLYLTNLGANRLLRNEAGLRFVDVTERWNAEDERLSVPAVFVDIDGDRDLDLYVGSYVAWSEATAKPCRSASGIRDYCSPKSFTPEPDRLFLNQGDRFSNETVGAGLSITFGPALGVVAADFDQNGSLDLYVANDGAANQLWLNQGLGRFEDEAPLAGVALNMDGVAEASMGVDAGDLDDDGDLDLFMTHLASESNTLYLNEGDGWFEDRTTTHGLGGPSIQMTGFGTALTDFDSDGLLDLIAVNGAVMQIASQVVPDGELPLRMSNQLFQNRGEGQFEDISASAGPPFSTPEVSRGLAVGDLDNDGDADAVITNNGGPARVLMNQAGDDQQWIGVDLREPSDAASVGALVRFDCGDRPPRWRRAHRDGSYASSSDPRVLLGLGDGTETHCEVMVIWPDGSRSSHAGLSVGDYHRIERPPAP
jgi:enediyne biosynthesis protein E4